MARLDVTETFQGITFPGHIHTQDSLSYATTFKFQDTDTLIVTYPKSGTTWMQEVATLISSRGDPVKCQTQPNWARAPWIEQYYCQDVLKASQGPRLLTTHLPYKVLAPALQGSKAKVWILLDCRGYAGTTCQARSFRQGYFFVENGAVFGTSMQVIYVARNPKDVVVSYYYFHKIAKFLKDPGTFSEFLSSFLEGTVYYGSWFDHVKEWTSNARTLDKFLYITYEEMWEDLRGSLKKVSQFLQCPLLEDELTSVQKSCSFNTMKENCMVNYTMIPQEIIDHSKGKFMRKGQIGDWVNTFSEEQSHNFDAVYASKMADSLLEFVWEKKKSSTDTEILPLCTT